MIERTYALKWNGVEVMGNDPGRAADAGAKLTGGKPRNPERGIDAGTKLLGGKPTNVERGVDAGTTLLKGESPRTAAGKDKISQPTLEQHRVYSGTVGKKVWAFRPNTANFIQVKGSEWNHVFDFGGLKQLLEKMQDNALSGQVANLSIVAHGDKPGVVQLERLLTPDSIETFRSPLTELKTFLKPNGKLIFMSCIAGKDKDGTALLNAISSILRDVYIIGFEIFGGYSGSLFAGPGQIWEDEFGAGQKAPMPKNPKWLTEFSFFSKWALNGKIIRLPVGEQISRPNKKCANPSCPGHLHGQDQCDSFP
jgi:hypothetical protein